MWTALLTVGLQLVGYFLKNSEVSDEQKKNFFAWVKQAGQEVGSAKLHNYGSAQLKWFDENPWKPGGPV